MTLRELYSHLVQSLSVVTDSPEFEAQVLLESVYGATRQTIYTSGETLIDESKVQPLLDKRLGNYPLQYLVGEWEFFGNTFKVSENTLIPRPETEILCECFAEQLKGVSDPVVLDLCSGTGCIGISIAKENPKVSVYLVEKFEKTLAVLKENILINDTGNTTPVLGDITDTSLELPLADFIVSNPPYIDTSDLAGLQVEVQHEPVAALDGGEDGLDFYRSIRDNCLRFLKPGGYIAVEFGETQAEQVKDIFSNLEFVKTITDYSGIVRVAIFKKVG